MGYKNEIAVKLFRGSMRSRVVCVKSTKTFCYGFEGLFCVETEHQFNELIK